MPIVLTLAFVGCGGGQSHSTGVAQKASPQTQTSSATKPKSGARPKAAKGGSRAELVAAADSICKRLNAELTARETSGSSTAEIVRVVPGNVALEKRAQRELGLLTAPIALASDWMQILTSREKLATELSLLVEYAKQDNNRAINALIISKKQTHAVLRSAARRDGFSDCAEVGQGPSSQKLTPHAQ